MNERELEDLYRRCAHLVHRRCLALLSDSAEAEEATQEVFIRAFQKLDPKGVPSPLAWLYSVSGNLCCDLLRRRKLQPDRKSSALLDEKVPEPAVVPQREDGATLGAVLRGVDETTRQIGLLHFLDGFTQEEVAERTGYSRRTVGKKLTGLRELFAQSFKERSAP